LTFGDVIQHRLGTFTPRLQQITVFHKLSAQLAATDLIFFEPYVGQGGQAQLVDTLVMLDGGADVAVGTVTPKAPDAGSPSGGQLLQVQGLPSNAAAGMFVCDVTQGNSCAMIDSMVDAGVAIMDQPFTNASYSMPATGLPAAVENNSWTTGDSVNVFTENLTNLKSWNPMGTDVTDAGVFSGGWVQFTEIAADTLTGTPNSVYPWISRGVTGVAGSKIDPRVQMSTQLGRGVAAIDIGNFHAGPVSVNAGTTGGPEFFGGTFNALTIGAGLGELAGDGIFHSVSGTSITLEDGTIFLAAPGAYLAGTLQLGSSGAPGFFKIGQGTALLYGPGGVSVKTASVFNAGLLWPNFLMTGALTLETATTGCVLNGLDAGAITCNIPLTTANLTAQKTLKNFNNGATFTDTTP
jgi:hypothetical protein